MTPAQVTQLASNVQKTTYTSSLQCCMAQAVGQRMTPAQATQLAMSRKLYIPPLQRYMAQAVGQKMF